MLANNAGKFLMSRVNIFISNSYQIAKFENNWHHLALSLFLAVPGRVMEVIYKRATIVIN
jgi:hypothetical protein